MASGSRHSVAITQETVYGVTDATPAFTPIRQTGCTLGQSSETLQSEETREDRQIVDVTAGAKAIKGDISFDLSYGSQDKLLEAALCGTFAARATITGTTISAAASDNSFNDSGNGFVTAGFVVGDKITVSGFTGAVANNANRVVTAVAAGKLTCAGADGDTIVDDAAGEAVTIVSRSQVLKAGTTRRSFTVERRFADILEAGKPYHRSLGVEVDSLKLDVAANALVSGSFALMGRNMTLAGTAIAGATYGTAPTTAILNSFTGTLLEGGVAVAIVTEISLSLENKLAERLVVGSDMTIQPDIGLSNVSGEIGVYFEDATMIEKYLNRTESSLSFTLPDAAGNSLTFNVPRLKYTSGQPDTKGAGSQLLKMSFQGLRDTTQASNIVITRTPA
jgi:hypothetical protein